jgi:hypothetical protein
VRGWHLRPVQGRRCRAQRKPLRLCDTMMLTELYYYSENCPAAKATSRHACRFSPTVRCNEAAPVLAGAAPPRPGLTRTDVLRRCTSQRVPANCTTAVMSAAKLRHNYETAPECELPLDKQSRNQLTGTATKTRDGPRLGNAKPPLTRPRRYPWPSCPTIPFSYLPLTLLAHNRSSRQTS